MKEKPPIVMTTLGLAVLFGLLYQLRQQRASAREIKMICHAVEKNLAETVSVHHTLRRTRGAVNQLHQYVMPETKGVKNTAS